MKKIIYTIFLILPLVACSKKEQVEVIVQTFPDQTKQFVHTYEITNSDSVPVQEIEYYHSGNVKMEGPLNKNGLRDGTWKAWFEDGSTWVTGEFKAGKNHGKRTVYFENGQKRMETHYENGNPVGNWLFWDENGKQIKVINH